MRLLSRVLAVAALAFATQAAGQAWPAKPIKVVVPYPAGGYYDVVGRVIGQKLSEALGQPVVVENRAGANAIIGTEFVAKSPADGYTIMVGGSGPHAINTSLYPKLPYDAVKDFAPVAHVSTSANTLVVAATHPANSLKDLLAMAKARPGAVSYASNGAGSTVHLCAELMASMAGLKLNHVPFKGSAPAITAVLGSQVDFAFATAGDVLPHIKAGKLKALAVTTARRVAATPDVPTMAEAGLPDFEAVAWFAFFAPAGTPADIVGRLNQEINRALREADVRERLSAQGSAELIGGPPERLGQLREKEIAKWAQVIRAAGVTPN